MKKVLVATLVFLTGFTAWYLSFSTFYESWIPYYYEEYLTHIFIAGSLVFLALPLCFAHIRPRGTLRIGYFRSFTWFGVFLFVLFLGITVYMVKTSIWLGHGAEPYRIVPLEK